MRSEDWIGHRQGRLVIEAFDGLRSFEVGKAAYFRFRCDCSNAFVAQKSNVIGQPKVDCGCSRPPRQRTAPDGASNHPLFKVWAGIIDRCENPKNGSFKDYGARGIAVCRRWKTGDGAQTGFECFIADMGPRPPGFTVERVQGHLGYQPSNCVWLAKGAQSKNRRTVRLIRIGTEVQTIPDWCAKTGVKYFTAMRRIDRGWSPDKAVMQATR